MSVSPVAEQQVGAGAALSAAFATARSLLGGAGRGGRWKTLTVLAAMAGLVGAGAAPPPLGLLQPVWEHPNLHQAVFGSPAAVGWMAFLVLFLIAMGGFARSFTLAFYEALHTGKPAAGGYRRWLRPGVAHFAWSAACTLPLYALLFLGEAVVSRTAVQEINSAINQPAITEAEFLALFGVVVLKFFLVLVPWIVLTLPLMVAVYELTPAAMVVERLPPAAAFRRVAARWKRHPQAFAGYVGLRYLLQFVGNFLALVALIPCLIVTSPLTGTLAGGGWAASGALGGTSTGPGAAAATVGALLAAVVLYCALCAALLPLTVVLNGLAVRFVDGRSGVDVG